jgi:hypothetical protein
LRAFSSRSRSLFVETVPRASPTAVVARSTDRSTGSPSSSSSHSSFGSYSSRPPYRIGSSSTAVVVVARPSSVGGDVEDSSCDCDAPCRPLVSFPNISLHSQLTSKASVLGLQFIDPALTLRDVLAEPRSFCGMLSSHVRHLLTEYRQRLLGCGDDCVIVLSLCLHILSLFSFGINVLLGEIGNHSQGYPGRSTD